jgi:hypothetical protein
MRFSPLPLGAPVAAAPPRGPASPRARWIPAPPKRGLELGEGLPTAPELSQAQTESIRTKAANAAEALQYELEAVKAEADFVSGATLRVEPDRYKSIAIVGGSFTPQEIRSQVIMDARAIEALATRLLTGAASGYIKPETADRLSLVVKDARALIAHEEQFDLQPITGPHVALAEQHVESHVGASRDLIEASERDVVAGEASSVPVTEPSGGSPLGALFAAAALVVVGLVIFDAI